MFFLPYNPLQKLRALLYSAALFQLEVLKHYLDTGGNVLVMLGEGGEMKYDTNINFLLEEYGIMVNNGTCWNFYLSVQLRVIFCCSCVELCGVCFLSRVSPLQMPL